MEKNSSHSTLLKNRKTFSNFFTSFFLPTFYFLLLTIFSSGCVTVRQEKEYGFREFPEPEEKGIYHKVKKGETLWRIARTYDVSMSDLITTNNIPSAAHVEENQLIFVPGRDAARDVLSYKESSEDDFIWPVRGKVLRYFHEREGASLNKGLDIAAQEGMKVKAARSGEVIFADYLAGHGYMVILEHGGGFYTIYAQNAKVLVKLGDRVSRSEDIAEVGGPTDLAYVHFEIRRNSVEDNPLYYLP